MSFVKRKISVQFVLKKGTLPGKDTNILNLDGYRCECAILQQGMSITGALQLKIYGMSLSDMNAISTVGMASYTVNGDYIAVSAGDEGGIMHLVFDGTIAAAYPDFSASPDVAFVISAKPGLIDMATVAAADQSPIQPMMVADKLASLAKLMGLNFIDHGVSSSIILRDQYLPGTNQDKVRRIVENSGICMEQTGSTMEIWPSGVARDGVVMQISPQSGMVGYPSYTQTGMQVRILFNPDAKMGRKAQISSIVVKNNAEWFVNGISHELSTLQPNGEWFTNLNLGYIDFVSRI